MDDLKMFGKSNNEVDFLFKHCTNVVISQCAVVSLEKGKKAIMNRTKLLSKEEMGRCSRI